MARTYCMTWVPSRRGWMKEYKGGKCAISCQQLSEQMGIVVPETKDDSYQAANAWWERKKAELDEASKPKLRPLLPMEDLAAAFFAGDPRSFDDPSVVISAVQGDEQVEYPRPEETLSSSTPRRSGS